MASNKKKIDINKASSEDLETLVGIGHAKAEAIAEARQVSFIIIINKYCTDLFTNTEAYFEYLIVLELCRYSMFHILCCCLIKAQGGFDSVNALLDIPGIGPVLLEQIRDVIICGKYPQKTPIQRKSDR